MLFVSQIWASCRFCPCEACWWVSARNAWAEKDSPDATDPAFNACFYEAADRFIEDFFDEASLLFSHFLFVVVLA